MWFHVVTRAYRYRQALCSPAMAPALWGRLRAAFPEALGAVLMSNHAQVVTPGESRKAVQMAMVGVVRATRRSLIGDELRFEPVPEPTVIEDATKVLRDLRYLALNPTRAGLVDDPLAWMWTTHRDLVGAVCCPWVSAERLATSVGWSSRNFAERYHAYASADPSTRVNGTPLPVPASGSEWPIVPLGDVLLASAAAHRGQPAHVRKRSSVRDTFFALARACGWCDARVLARVAGISPDGVRWNVRRGIEVPAAAWLCLGDARLLSPLRSPASGEQAVNAAFLRDAAAISSL
jgi:hypothetical protein